MKIVNYLFNHYFNPLIVALLTILIVGGASKKQTETWSEWLSSIPRIVWILFVLIIFLWILIIAAKKRLDRLKHDKYRNCIYVNPTYGWKDVLEIFYSDVIWIVQVPRDPMPLNRNEYIDPSSINIDTPPRCPKCKTGIEQKPHLLWGYIWECVKCDFKKRSKNSYYKEKNRAEKIAEREIEISQSE